MDVVSLGFILLMVVVGGVVAYIADNLGRTLGKKRLTIGKLRPRHTATLMTVAAGMLIPLVTVLAVSAVSSDVRMWIAEGRQAIAERDRALDERDTARRDVESLRGEQEKLRTENAGLLAQIEQGKRELSEVRNQLTSLENQVTDLNSQLSDLNRKLVAANSDLKKAQHERGKVEASLAALQGEFQDLNSTYRELNQNYVALDTSYNELHKIKNEYDIEFNRLSLELEELEEDKADLLAEQEELQRQIDEAKRNLDQSRSALERERINLDEARAQMQAAEAQLNMLQAGIATLTDLLGDSRTKPLMFAMGQEVARVAVPEGVDLTGARAYLQALIKRASDIAAENGAKPLRGSQAAGLVQREDQDGNPITIEEQENLLSESIQKETSEVLLVARSLVNSFQGEFVGIDVRVYRNPLVYRDTDVVSETRIFGQQSEVDIYNQIASFLQTTLKDEAMKDGMIPVGGPEMSLGEVSSEDMFGLMRNIKQHGRPVRLIALANGDTRAGDTLKLEFRLR